MRLLKSIISSAIPVLINLEAMAFIGMVDLDLAGRLSAAAQAAVGLGDQLLFLTSTAATGLSVATCAIVSRYFGAGNFSRARTAVKAGLMVATISGIVALFAGLVFAESFVRLLSSDREVITYGARYIQLCAIGSLPYVMMIVIASIFRAIGKTAESLHLALTAAAISVILSYAIFLLPNRFSHSLDALCLAWIIGAYTGLGVGSIVLLKHLKKLGADHTREAAYNFGVQGTDERQRPRHAQKELRQLRKFVKLMSIMGGAVVLADSSTLATDFLVYKLLSSASDATNMQAAWTIFLKLEETFAIMPLTALALAFAAVVGQSIGQNQEHETKRCLSFLLAGSSILLALSGTFLAAAPQVMAYFTHSDQTVINWTQQLLALTPLFFPLLGVRLLMFSYLEGAGQTSEPMRMALLGNAIKLIVGFLLLDVMSLGMIGLSVAILVSRSFLAVASVGSLAARFKTVQPI
jgi:Na+-driven multidrug efflux pump